MEIYTLLPISEHDEVAQAEEKRQRKRIQNRLNQRAHRFRVREEEAPDSTSKRHPFQVHRWRLEHKAPATAHVTSASGSGRHQTHVGNDLNSKKRHYKPESLTHPAADINDTDVTPLDTRLSLPADHLLHLIHYNVFGGIHITKEILEPLTVSVIPGAEHEVVPGYGPFPGSSMLLTPSPDVLPKSLVPTLLQMEAVHPTWINLFPFPKVRNNLISWQNCFNHVELVEDLLGSTCPAEVFASPWASQGPIGVDDEVTTARNGLILWGEPHRAELGSDAGVSAEVGLGRGGLRGVNRVQ
ncbi:hypothetical protein BBP40_001243 [Aspergillus hancockii]|nr:hypothetical protein BBP40_001243 [Aspergillus hancockii]